MNKLQRLIQRLRARGMSDLNIARTINGRKFYAAEKKKATQ